MRILKVLLVIVVSRGAVAARPCAGQDVAAHHAAVRTMFDGPWSTGSFTALDGLLAPEFRFHFRGRSNPMNATQFRDMVTSWRTAFPDLRFQVEDVVGSGERVAARFTFTGTHSAPMWGIQPTGRKVSVTMMAFFRFANGRIVEMWEDYDEHGLRQQLTAPPR
jgi:steroid delta-isomerase-like uncharacterized protein